jgi:CheY-like chemotaxis protein
MRASADETSPPARFPLRYDAGRFSQSAFTQETRAQVRPGTSLVAVAFFLMPTRPLKVFLVEDMKHLQVLMGELLTSLGNFQLAGTAASEAEASIWLDEHADDWDLVIADLVLDQGTGFGVVKKCRQRAAGRKVLVLSDYVTPGIHRHCLALGADAAMMKSDMPAFLDFCRGLDADASVG